MTFPHPTYCPGGGPPSVSYVTTVTDAVDASVFTFTATSIGAADSTRRVFAAITWADPLTLTLSSCTIDSAAATIHVQTTRTSNSLREGVAIVSVAQSAMATPTATTATIVVTISGTGNGCGVSTYRSVNQVTAAAHATNSAHNNATTLDVSLNVPAGGFVIAISGGPGGSDAIAHTWVGVTEDYESAFATTGARNSGGSISSLVAETPRTVTISATGAATPCAACSASFS